MSNEYKLSACLYGHSLDVRSVTVSVNNDIISGSRDKTAKLWRYNPVSQSYAELMTYRDQKNFVGSVLYLEPSEEYPDGLIVTGGNDKLILIYKPSEPFATFTFAEHTNAVCCLTKCNEPNAFLSGSWDTTVKNWSIPAGAKSLITFTGHTAAVWSILQLQDSRVVTASADRTIGVWAPNGSKLQSLSGHTDCVRSLADFPQYSCFMSTSNDASIKVWSYSGENVDTFYGHSSFVYSITRCKNANDIAFATSDEEYSIKLWKQDGENTQTLNLPAQSVWTVATLSNGDIVSGSSDGVVRIFTQDERRVADPVTTKKFNEDVAALIQQNTKEIGGYKVSDLPGKEALYNPGKKAGQKQMVREGNIVNLYTWVEDSEGNGTWDKVGEVLSGTNKENEKTEYEGMSYDYVFTVDVEDGKPPLRLPYNKGQDPYQAAHAFMNINGLPAEYLEQIVNFILTNSGQSGAAFTAGNLDPLTGGSSYSTQSPSAGPMKQNENAPALDPFTGTSSYASTSHLRSTVSNNFFPQLVYRSFDMGDPSIVIKKLKEFNLKASEQVDETDLDKLVQICNSPITDVPIVTRILSKLLDWPNDLVFPALDVIRLSVRNTVNNEIIASATLIDKLNKYLIENETENNTIVSLRTLCNLCLHQQGENLVFEHRFDILENITALGFLNKNGQIALATLLLNLTILSIKRNDELGFSVLADVLPDILTKLFEVESHFRTYVALGTLLCSCNSHVKEVKLKVNSNVNFQNALQLHSLSGQTDLEKKRSSCAKLLQNLL